MFKMLRNTIFGVFMKANLKLFFYKKGVITGPDKQHYVYPSHHHVPLPRASILTQGSDKAQSVKFILHFRRLCWVVLGNKIC